LSEAGRPDWLRVKHVPSKDMDRIRELNRQLGLKTVCDAAHCPNIGECWSQKSATYLILGDLCTRHCLFCAVDHGSVGEHLEKEEPWRIAQAVKGSSLDYAVITSVTRDDLSDGGAGEFASTVRAIKLAVPKCRVEVLIPDMNGDEKALKVVLGSKPEVLGHNIEVVRRLQGTVRDAHASYDRSIGLLERSKGIDPGTLTKSSIMLGIGETHDEVIEALQDLRDVNVDILTIGQYLRPGPDQIPVQRYVHPDEFEKLREKALEMGFRAVMAGPFVRSSYKAKEAYQIAKGE
jgi:lipoic acid synthetase